MLRGVARGRALFGRTVCHLAAAPTCMLGSGLWEKDYHSLNSHARHTKFFSQTAVL